MGAAILYHGLPHVFYYDGTSGNLRHAYYNGSAWIFETLDGAGGPNGRIDTNVGRHNTAVIYNGRPHVFYQDFDAGDLRHGYYNGSAWIFETLDGQSNGPNGRVLGAVGEDNTAVLYNGRPHVFYYSPTFDTLRHAYWNGSAWGFETLDGDGGSHGRINSDVGQDGAAILYNGRPHAFYYDNTNGDLRHAYYNGSAWIFETLDGNGGPNGRIVGTVGQHNAAGLYSGRPHVYYNEFGAGYLRHGYWNGSAWGFETLDGDGGTNGRISAPVGGFNSVILSGGLPHVFYYDYLGNDLRHGRFG